MQFSTVMYYIYDSSWVDYNVHVLSHDDAILDFKIMHEVYHAHEVNKDHEVYSGLILYYIRLA
jgi:hypothetical protein